MITHYDLFAGIGGNSIALEEVFKGETIRHIFCEWESFPTAVIKQHWPDGEYWGDIADLVEHTSSRRLSGVNSYTTRQKASDRIPTSPDRSFTIVTGGFPCQPFSHAGRRKGTADDRYKWPEMFAVIRNVKPDWVVAENVRGLVTWNEGMVLEQVCSDLESEGYEVQPIIIPAVAVNAPHRRDRVWIIANRNNTQANTEYEEPRGFGRQSWEQVDTWEEASRPQDRKDGDDEYERCYPDWSRDWREVALASCDGSLDDGLSRDMGGATISYAKYRRESLKALGNSIVPQVAINIFQAIKEAN